MIELIFPNSLTYHYNEKTFSDCTTEQAVRYLKGLYTNFERFESKYLTRIDSIHTKALYAEMAELYHIVEPYGYKEAFELENASFKNKVFTSINVTEMMANLGSKRINTAGIEVERKQFSETGEFLGMKSYHNVYEIYEVDGSSLVTENRAGSSTDLYAVKCWCTSTNKEHWLWIEEKYKDCPLTAIASTFRIHENVIPHISELKRQGDIMLVEMKEEVTPEGNIRPLTKDEYFGLLTCES